MSGTWTRREWLTGAAAATAAVALPAAWAQNGPPVVKTPSGSLRGSVGADGVRIFRGVPFARPPVGALRFLPPVPMAAWDGVREATRPAASAVQPDRSNTSEDCLYLNVFAPAGSGPFPVFVWIHGGGFTGGTPNDFDGTVFARQGVVLVTVAYRLGVFGFLDWSPMLGPKYADSANNAVRDLVCSLQWVHDNIAGFGGDPSRVTIGGESAGAKLTGILLGVREAAPLFSAAISESGGAERIRATGDSAAVTAAFRTALEHAGGTAAGVRNASPELLLRAQRGLIDGWDGNFPLRAESGGALLPHRAVEPIAQGNARGKRLLIGTNRDESALFLGDHAAQPLTQRNLGNTRLAQVIPVLEQYRRLYPQMTPAQLNIRALSAEEYWMPSLRLAEALVQGGGSAWFYRLDEEAATGRYAGQAYHSFDIGFVWERLARSEPEPAQRLAVAMHDAWVAFIKGGAPAAAGLPAWPQWNPRTRPTMILNNTSTVEQQPFEAERKLWDGFPFA